VQVRWKTFEDQARDVAGHVFGRPCHPRQIAGSDIDGVIDLAPNHLILIEATVNHTVEKVRTDLVKLTNVRNALMLKGVFARCIVVTQKLPTPGMAKGSEENNIEVISIDQFAAMFLEYERYRIARLQYPFGSAINPESGEIDTTKYVPVPYIDRVSEKSYSHKDISEKVLSGQNVVVLGEYGSGKSRCVAEVYDHISKEWGASFKFPIAVNLRECWGLEDADEIVRRHFTKLGLEDMRPSAVKAYNRHAIIFLLDGFDEIGIQAWSSDAERLREVRAQALSGVQDAVKNSGTGTLITGREHYFSSEKEMLASLGLSKASTLILHVKEEFSLEELQRYFYATGIDVALPDWLPRRPLICQTIAHLSEEDRESMFGAANNESDFWNHFIRIVCARDARINKSFNADTIYDVFVSLANLTRTKEANTGPINQRELQEAFENSVGALPVENASVMLQRLPSLGRVATDSADRQFIDTYILDGLRAKGISRIVDSDEEAKVSATSARWINCLRPLGQKVLASEASKKLGGFLNLAQRAAGANNRTIAGDIVASFLQLKQGSVDFEGLRVADAPFSELDFSGLQVSNLTILECTVDELVLPAKPPLNTSVSGCLITKVSGSSSKGALAPWVAENEIEQLDSVRTMRRIKDAGLNPGHEILVVMLKKVFFQPGTGRKEEALLRGFEAGKHVKLAPKVIGLLKTHKIVDSFKGNDGLVYTPNRAMTSRMQAILDELKSSQDPVWLAVAKL
jgi:hypothetical protein